MRTPKRHQAFSAIFQDVFVNVLTSIPYFVLISLFLYLGAWLFRKVEPSGIVAFFSTVAEMDRKGVPFLYTLFGIILVFFLFEVVVALCVPFAYTLAKEVGGFIEVVCKCCWRGNGEKGASVEKESKSAAEVIDNIQKYLKKNQ